MTSGCLVTRAGDVAALWLLAALDARIHEAERTELELLSRQRGSHKRDVEAVGTDKRHVQLRLERVREVVHAAQVERERLLREIQPALAARYDWLWQLGTLAFIVPVRDGRCAGCAGRLSTSLLELLRRPDVIGSCPRCERMLHGRGPDG